MYKKKEQRPKGSPPWMTTFSDLMTLLLVFFVLLFAFSEINMVKFQAVADSFKRSIFEFYPSAIPFEQPFNSQNVVNQGSSDANQQATDGNQTPISDKKLRNVENEKQLDQVQKVIQAFLEENQLQDVITATREEHGVVLVLQEKILFDSGKADILEIAKPFLDKVGLLIKVIPNDIQVEGHTDNIPIQTFRYPSNWELSAARASSVVRYLSQEHQIDQKRFKIIGYGEQQPIATNDTLEGRQLNRRVVIVINSLVIDEASSQ